MFLNLNVKDGAGKMRGAVRMRLDFDRHQWFIDNPSPMPWQFVGFSRTGAFEVKDWGVSWIWDRDGGTKRNTIIFWDPPKGEDDYLRKTGKARLYDPKDRAFKDGIVDWAVDRTAQPAKTGLALGPPAASPIRAAMNKVLGKLLKDMEKHGGELSSDTAEFANYTGFTTKTLKLNYWDKEFVTVKDPKDPTKTITKPNPERNFTTCNAFLGKMARLLGAELGVPPGKWLNAGVLQLDWVDKDLPGSWVPVDPSGKLKPQVGDFYSRPLPLSGNLVQKFGHVGIVAEFKGSNWFSVDGGQGGRSKEKDFIKKVDRKTYDPSQINGWCDIEKYFAHVLDPKNPKPKP